MSDLIRTLESIQFPQVPHNADKDLKRFQQDLDRYMKDFILTFTSEKLLEEVS